MFIRTDRTCTRNISNWGLEICSAVKSSLVPSTHVQWLRVAAAPAPEDLMLSSGLCEHPCTHGRYTDRIIRNKKKTKPHKTKLGLKALTVLPEDLGLNPSNHGGSHPCVTPVAGDLTPSSGPQGHQACKRHAGKTFTTQNTFIKQQLQGQRLARLSG